MPDFLISFPALTGEHSAGFLLLVLFFATFASEDLACLAAGTLAAQGRIGFASAVAACFLGIFVGDMMLYWAGRALGGRVVGSRIFRRFVSASSVRSASAWLEKRGAAAVFLSRFVTGLRLPTYLAAGVLHTDFAKFALYFAIAAALWTPILVGSAMLWQQAVPEGLIAGAVLSYLSVRIAIKLSNWKSRRILLGRIRRIANWEFWPLWLFYFPVVCYVLLLGLRHRSLTAFAAANPGIPAGGFVGESKDAIYRMIARSEAASKFVLRHRLVEAKLSFDEKLAAAGDLITENRLSFPVVLKPDSGERGKGVRIVSSRRQMEGTLARSKDDLIIQEFFDGVEASIFYCRIPGEERGRIFSITEKRFPKVVGDGRSTLETLILRDDRAVCMARSYFDHNRECLDQVPAVGEAVALIDIGTHSRGAVFLDGEWLRTEKLERTIDTLCREIDGFYFGRFDIRAGSFDDLRGGENFRIIELNGVTSESTNIYDPRYSLIDAYRILFKQWRLAFRIGRENIKMGAGPVSALSLIEHWLASLSGKST